MTQGNRVGLLSDGEEIFPAMLEAIGRARFSVDFLAYAYWRGAICDRFAEALADAARRGVEVRVLFDAHGSFRMRAELPRRLDRAGCRVARFRPVRWRAFRRAFETRRFGAVRWLNRRTHRRALVVDGRVGFAGGVGVGLEWSEGGAGLEPWREAHFRVEGPAVADIRAAFAENWREATGERLAGKALGPLAEAPGDAAVVTVPGRPEETPSTVEALYLLTLRAAARQVEIATPYLVPSEAILAELERAAARGVAVRVLVPNRHNDIPPVRWASRTFYRRLLEAGIRLFEYQPTMMHAKTMTVDDAWSVIGSANLDFRSFDLNFELQLGVVDPALNASIRGCFEDDLRRSREVTLEEVDGWSLPERLRDRTARLLKEQL